jgi:hypothetical protein
MDRATATAAYHLLSVAGPGLTALGAGLLAFDVMRGPFRLNHRQQHAERLETAAALRDDSARPFATAVDGRSTEERKIAVARINDRFDRAIGRVKRVFDRAVTLESDRAFYLGVLGLVLVGLGGICETTAATLEWVAHVR